MWCHIQFGSKPYYRFVCGLGAVANILMMMIANLVGFCVGVDGMIDMLNHIFGTADGKNQEFILSIRIQFSFRVFKGLRFLVTVIVCLFIAVQIMFEIRETEKRKGDPRWKM